MRQGHVLVGVDDEDPWAGLDDGLLVVDLLVTNEQILCSERVTACWLTVWLYASMSDLQDKVYRGRRTLRI